MLEKSPKKTATTLVFCLEIVELLGRVRSIFRIFAP
jgi:hypothetical protein